MADERNTHKDNDVKVVKVKLKKILNFVIPQQKHRSEQLMRIVNEQVMQCSLRMRPTFTTTKKNGTLQQ